MADESKLLDVSVVTPQGPAFEGEAEMIIVPGAEGEIGVLARHAPLEAMLGAGETRIHQPGSEPLRLITGPGFFQVQSNRAIALVDDAVRPDAIDRERAQEQLDSARAELDQLESGETDAGRWQLQQRIKHAENQLARSE